MTARVYSRFLPEFLPGRPSIIVRAMPGGAGTIGSNFVYSSKPDGLTILITTSSAKNSYLFGVSGAKYDMLKMPTVLALKDGNTVFIKPGIISKPEDIAKVKNVTYGMNPGGTSYTFLMMKDLMELPVKVVLAYAGDADAFRAFVSGEINCSGSGRALYTTTVKALVDKGEIMDLYQTGDLNEKGDFVRAAVLPHVITGQELYEKAYGKPPSGQAWEAYKMLIVMEGFEKSLHLPPGTPDDIVKAWNEAAEKMSKSPAFLEALAPMFGRNPDLVAGETAERLFKAGLRDAAKPELIRWFKETMNTKYGIVI